jgi:hypothetical protein
MFDAGQIMLGIEILIRHRLRVSAHEGERKRGEGKVRGDVARAAPLDCLFVFVWSNSESKNGSIGTGECPEIVIEGFVFVEDHEDIFYRRAHSIVCSLVRRGSASGDFVQSR